MSMSEIRATSMLNKYSLDSPSKQTFNPNHASLKSDYDYTRIPLLQQNLHHTSALGFRQSPSIMQTRKESVTSIKPASNLTFE